MARSFCVILLFLSSTFPASAQTGPNPPPNSWRIGGISYVPAERPQPALVIGQRGRVGFGMFGLKPESAHSGAVTVREVTAPRHRRAGVGFSLRF